MTPAEALRHPTWRMGPRITVDSATLINKAMEIVEARWLFDVPAERIEVVVHPQSIVHSLVEFVDGSVVAQMGPPDMRTPIRYALGFPERLPSASPRFDVRDYAALTFAAPDRVRFPGLELGFEAARRGGTAGAALNGADEAAVDAFLAGSISFPADRGRGRGRAARPSLRGRSEPGRPAPRGRVVPRRGDERMPTMTTLLLASPFPSLRGAGGLLAALPDGDHSVQSVVLAILGVGFLIFVHELGHFLACRLTKTRVETFSIGFGRRLFGWETIEGQRRFTVGARRSRPTDGTDVRIALIPLGGYVKMAGEIGGDGTATSGAGGEPRATAARRVSGEVVRRTLRSSSAPA